MEYINCYLSDSNDEHRYNEDIAVQTFILNFPQDHHNLQASLTLFLSNTTSEEGGEGRMET